MSLKSKLLALSAGVILIVAILAFALPVSAATGTLLDVVNIGTTISEDGHNLVGWGPVENNHSGGGYGSIGPNGCRCTWSPFDMDGNPTTDERWAEVTLNANGSSADQLVVRVLDGLGDDSFKIYVNDEQVFEYPDTPPTWDSPELWKVHTIDITRLNINGLLTVKIESTGAIFPWFNPYGQLGVDWIELYTSDSSGPITSDVQITPNPVAVNTQITLTAVVGDSIAGGSDIASVFYKIDEGSTLDMDALDEAFDEVIEDVYAPVNPFYIAGVYNISVWGTDAAGKTGQPVSILLAVYDPSAGFVTGGGWINSPAGAYVADPEMTGKATFGFVSKYQKGATVPTGQTQFQFHAAGLNFHSSSYQWMVIAGAKAQYKGAGTINGTGNYGFMLTAIDGQINGGGDGADKFRIKIWDKDTGDTVVYDNQIGDDDTAPPDTTLGGGSIVIHSGK